MPFQINGFTPQSGPVGTRVALDMDGLPPGEGDLQIVVLFDNADAGGNVERAGASQIVAEVPEGATTGTITAKQQLYSGEWEYAQSADDFQVTAGQANPVITSVSSSSRPGGSILVRGQNFGGVQTVRLGPAPMIAVPTFTRLTSMTLQFTVPLNTQPGQYRVYLTCAGGGQVTSPSYVDIQGAASA